MSISHTGKVTIVAENCSASYIRLKLVSLLRTRVHRHIGANVVQHLIGMLLLTLPDFIIKIQTPPAFVKSNSR